MDLINSNHLLVSINDAHRFGVDPGVCYYRSGDHGKRRLESNWNLAIWRLWVSVKWRPDGKRHSE